MCYTAECKNLKPVVSCLHTGFYLYCYGFNMVLVIGIMSKLDINGGEDVACKIR